jgi:putative endonuclease
MLQLTNGSYYTGYTTDLQKRIRAHRSGRGAKITRSFAPLRIAACWKLKADKGAAMRVEACIKSCTRRVKQSLIDNPVILQQLLRGKGSTELPEAVVPPPPIDQF